MTGSEAANVLPGGPPNFFVRAFQSLWLLALSFVVCALIYFLCFGFMLGDPIGLVISLLTNGSGNLFLMGVYAIVATPILLTWVGLLNFIGWRRPQLSSIANWGLALAAAIVGDAVGWMLFNWFASMVANGPNARGSGEFLGYAAVMVLGTFIGFVIVFPFVALLLRRFSTALRVEGLFFPVRFDV